MSKDLTARIKGAAPGAVIDLQGEPLGKISLRLDARNITLRGLKASSIVLTQVQNLTIEDFDVDFVPDETTTWTSQAVRATSSVKLRLLDGRVRGGPAVNGRDAGSKPGDPAPDKSGNVRGKPAGRGINIAGAVDLVIDAVLVEKFHKGIILDDVTRSLLRNSIIQRLRTTNLTIGQSSDLTIEQNIFRESQPWAYGGDGDHGDAIHAWTQKGSKRSIDRLRIISNTILQGFGAPMMAIFLEDNSGEGYRAVEVLKNFISQAHAHGIFVNNADGRVDENILTWTGDGTRHNNAPRIRPWNGCRDMSLRGNIGPIEMQKGQDPVKSRLAIAA